jgi:uncharacterized membrane-anchored protein
MRRTFAILAGLAVLVLANLTIFQRERLLADGRVVLLALAPVDPRSLMQGDYMALDYGLARDLSARTPPGEVLRDGHVVLALDAQNVASFVHFEDGSPLAPDQIRLRYRVREGEIRFATNAFFFQEGEAKRYEPARFGEFRVAADGEAILTGLRDAQARDL